MEKYFPKSTTDGAVFSKRRMIGQQKYFVESELNHNRSIASIHLERRPLLLVCNKSKSRISFFGGSSSNVNSNFRCVSSP